jgi:hypothetical protein
VRDLIVQLPRDPRPLLSYRRPCALLPLALQLHRELLHRLGAQPLLPQCQAEEEGHDDQREIPRDRRCPRPCRAGRRLRRLRGAAGRQQRGQTRRHPCRAALVRGERVGNQQEDGQEDDRVV